MKVGDLVRRVDNWLKHNPWMGSDDNEEYGIVIVMPEKMIYKPSIRVLWATLGVIDEHPDDIELLDETG